MKARNHESKQNKLVCEIHNMKSEASKSWIIMWESEDVVRVEDTQYSKSNKVFVFSPLLDKTKAKRMQLINTKCAIKMSAKP